MPCRGPDFYYDGPPPSTLKNELDLVTRLLCGLLSEIPEEYIKPGTELEKWWDQHKKLDAERKRLEAEAKKLALERERKERERKEAEEIKLLKELQKKYGKKSKAKKG